MCFVTCNRAAEYWNSSICPTSSWPTMDDADQRNSPHNYLPGFNFTDMFGNKHLCSMEECFDG